jgi:hypothetical protein
LNDRKRPLLHSDDLALDQRLDGTLWACVNADLASCAHRLVHGDLAVKERHGLDRTGFDTSAAAGAAFDIYPHGLPIRHHMHLPGTLDLFQASF